MSFDLIRIGNGNYVSGERIVAVINPDSAPVKRMIQEAKEERRLIDATFGKKTRSVIITDSDHVILISQEPEAVFFSQEESAKEGEGLL